MSCPEKNKKAKTTRPANRHPVPTPVPGYPGLGAFRNGTVYRQSKDGRWELLSPVDTKSHYLKVWYGKKAVRVHTLVLLAFAGPAPKGHVARHLNDCRLDNRAVNLAWGTQAENMRDAKRNGGSRARKTDPKPAKPTKTKDKNAKSPKPTKRPKGK